MELVECHRASSIGHVISFILSNFFKDFIGYPRPCSIAWVSHHHNDQWYMVLLNGRLPKIGFFLSQLCLNTQINGKIGRKVAFSRSSMVLFNGRLPKLGLFIAQLCLDTLQWEIPQAWFLSCSIVSTYSTTMTKLMFPLLAPQLQKKQWWRCSMVLLNGKFPKLGFFLS